MFVDNALLDTLLRGLALSSVALVWVIVVVRLVGLRAFSKMTAFDFVVTVATGSLLAGASQAASWSPFFQACLAIAMLLAVQYAVAKGRARSQRFAAVLRNTPVLLMEDGDILEPALAFTRVSRDDVIAKLREADVQSLSDVRAVVLETTGNISVLSGSAPDKALLEHVRRIE